MARLERETAKICARIWKSDNVALHRMISPDMGYNELVRTIIHKFVVEATARANAKIDAERRADSTLRDATPEEIAFATSFPRSPL